MTCIHIIAIVCTAICLVVFLSMGIRLLFLGSPKDLAEPAGKVSKGVIYSCTVAMAPGQKESAYKHLPTYTAGILFHIGTFVMLVMFILALIDIFTPINLPQIVLYIVAGILTLSALCGLGILIKRFIKRDLRYISTLDDYISNILTTGSQIATIVYILTYPAAEPYYFITMSLLMLWMPIGKTKHLLYFFFARFHLGFFYGSRGSWPIPRSKKGTKIAEPIN